MLGPEHIKTLEALGALALAETDPARALELIGEQCRTFDRDYAEQVYERVDCHSYEALFAEAVGRTEDARAIYEAILSLQSADTDPDDLFFFQLAAGHARRLAGDPRGAIEALEPVVAQYAASPAPWARLRAANAQLGIGLAELALERRQRADPQLRAVAAAFDDAYRRTPLLAYRLRADLARNALTTMSGPASP